MTGLVAYALEGGAARITMNDGKVNAMSLAMLTAIDAALDRARKDGAIVVLRSAREGIFSAGFDLKLFAANDPEASWAMVRAGAELALKMLSFERPIIGVWEGHAYPMAAFLLLASDIRIGAEGAQRIGLNEVAIGIPVPSFAIELARQRLHPAWLSRTVATGEMYQPRDALQAGFIDQLVAPDAVEPAIESAIDRLSNIHLQSHQIAKQRLRRQACTAIREAIDAEITLEAYQATAARRAAVKQPGAAAG